MIALWLVAALLGFVAIGLGVSLLRAGERPPLAGGFVSVVRQWTGTLAGQRAVGAGLVALGALVIVLVLVLRP